MSANTVNKSIKSKSKTEKQRRPISGMIMFGLAFLIVIFIAVAHLIVIEECAPPCRGEEETEACARMGCARWTLWDEISYRFNTAIVPKSEQSRGGAKTGSYTKTVADYDSGRAITFIYDDSSITVEFDEPLVCIKAPCGDYHVSNKLNFSDEHFDMVYDFLSSLKSGTNYNDLDYTEKRIVSSAVENSEDDIDLYRVRYYEAGTNTNYYIEERSGKVSITVKGHQGTRLPILDEDKLESLIDLVHQICEIENEFDVNYSKEIESELDEDEVWLLYWVITQASIDDESGTSAAPSAV